MEFEEALRELKGKPKPTDASYHAACEVIADNLDKLQYRLFIHLPGGLNGDTDPAWEKVKAASVECCSCGNERFFEPHNLRDEFVPSTADPIVMAPGRKLYIRAVGAPASSAYFLLEVVQASAGVALTVLEDPLSPSFNFEAIFSTKGFPLEALIEPLQKLQGKPAVLLKGQMQGSIPILGIASVDKDKGTFTLILDEAVEAFDPDTEKATHKH